MALLPRGGDDTGLPDTGPHRVLRELPRTASDRGKGRGIPEVERLEPLALLDGNNTRSPYLRDTEPAGCHVDRIPALLDKIPGQHRLLYLHGPHHGVRIHSGRGEPHNDDSAHEGPGHDLGEIEHVRVDDARGLHPAARLRAHTRLG